jgi:hypothetical protein
MRREEHEDVRRIGSSAEVAAGPFEGTIGGSLTFAFGVQYRDYNALKLLEYLYTRMVQIVKSMG